MCTMSQGLKWIKNGYNMIPAFKKYKLNEVEIVSGLLTDILSVSKTWQGYTIYVEKCYEERKERNKEGP